MWWLKATMPESEFQAWMHYHAETPIDDVSVHHLAVAQVAMLVANVNRDPKKRRKPYTVEDFLPFGALKSPSKPESPESLTARLNMFFAGLKASQGSRPH